MVTTMAVLLREAAMGRLTTAAAAAAAASAMAYRSQKQVRLEHQRKKQTQNGCSVQRYVVSSYSGGTSFRIIHVVP